MSTADVTPEPSFAANDPDHPLLQVEDPTEEEWATLVDMAYWSPAAHEKVLARIV